MANNQPWKVEKFKDETIKDKLILDLIDSYYELKYLMDSTDLNPIEYDSIRVGKRNQKNIVRIEVLKEKIKTNSSLLMS